MARSGLKAGIDDDDDGEGLGDEVGMVLVGSLLVRVTESCVCVKEEERGRW
jgi:hypothetical protein